jgi:CheY-like chemotaxis protein
VSTPYILVVDDNPANLKLVAYLLKLGGYDVGGATDARETKRMIAARRPDLLLLDLQLPDADGLELARQLKSDPATEDIVVVAVTARAMKGDRNRALAAGCDGYVSKPIDTNTFLDVVGEFLDCVSPRQEMR